MFQMSVPWWEFILRGVIVYAFLLVFLRVTGRRQTGQYAPFDLVLLLILSNAVQNAMNAGDNSLIGGLISAATLLVCHSVLGRVGFHSKRAARLIDGQPYTLIEQGEVNRPLMRQQLITVEDVQAALRAGGCLHAHEVERATLETNGQITVVLRARDTG